MAASRQDTRHSAALRAAEMIINSTPDNHVPIISRNQMPDQSGAIYPPLPGQSRMANPNLRPHIPVIVSDDVVSGTQRNGRMSPVRRFFCLLVTFDVLFVSLLWIITILLTGRDLKAALRQQVLEYTIACSMFDCVFVAFSRFVICILFFAALDLSHWWPIALTTSGTSAFLIAKVFEYEWSKQSQMTFDVMLVLLSFILAWSELWFLDFRVIPLELRAQEIADSFEDSETRPLLMGQQYGRETLRRYLVDAVSGYEGTSVGNFYSPMESPDASDDEMEPETGVTVPRRFKRKTPLSQTESEYRKLGEEALQTAWRILNSPGWKLEKSLDNGDTVHSKHISRGKKIFKLNGIVDIPPKLLLEELFYQIETVPSWNPTLVECKLVQHIDSHTDVSYQVCAEAAQGVVSTRDFVNLRHWDVVDDVFVSSGVSIKHPAMPEQPKRVRGENGPGCWAMRPVPGNPDQCQFEWLLDTDLKGWIPQYIIDSALAGAQFDYIKNIRTYAASLHQNGRVQNFLEGQAAAGQSLNETISTVVSMS